MHPEIIAEICEKIYCKFPEVNGIKPKIRQQPVPKDEPQPDIPVYLLTFHTQARGPGGIEIPHWVRAAVSPDGKIKKITVSR